jgi:hypothetical protein
MCLFALLVVIVILAAIQADAAPRPYVLRYRCENDVEGGCTHSGKKAFVTRLEAIDWVTANYTFYPIDLTHGKVLMPCVTKYLDADDPDPITKFRKEVECNTPRRLDEEFGEGKWSTEADQVSDHD